MNLVSNLYVVEPTWVCVSVCVCGASMYFVFKH